MVDARVVTIPVAVAGDNVSRKQESCVIFIRVSTLGIAKGKKNKSQRDAKKNPPRVLYAGGVRKALSGVGLLLRGS